MRFFPVFILSLGVALTACENSTPTVQFINGPPSSGGGSTPTSSGANFSQMNSGSQRLTIDSYNVTTRIGQPLGQISSSVDGYSVRGSIILQK